MDPTYLDHAEHLKDWSGSWEADGLLHQPVQNLIGQVVGRPNKKNETVLRIQITGESILESELFKEETKNIKVPATQREERGGGQ
jgi:hypothetical protein